MNDARPADARVFSTPAGVKLGPIDQIADAKARVFVLQLRAGRFHGFIVRRGGNVWGYVDRCPHMGLPMTQRLDEYLTPNGDLIACSWHSALFDVEDGTCVGGPCKGQRLTPWPIVVENDMLVTA